MDRPIHVVGGGIAGLVAAITAAEAGVPVVLHEAAEQLGGRALGGVDNRGVNLGPHAVWTDGALVRWLRAHDLGVQLRPPTLRGLRVLDDRGSHFPFFQALWLAPTAVPRQAPVDETFAEWADRAFGSRRGVLMCRLAGLFCYHHDPGTLSAKFVWDRYRRTFLSVDRLRYIAGGWSTLIDALAERALSLGVDVKLAERITSKTIPDAPTIVATKLSAASRLVERMLHWPGTRAALFDVVAEGRPGWPSAVADVRSDLATCCMIERETAIDPELLGGGGGELFQAQLGIAPDLAPSVGIGRIEDGLDHAVEGWRDRVLWRRGHVVVEATGAVDPPGASWRDRPPVELGDDVFLAGDAVAAPGMLSEVAVNSGVHAARLALEARRRRAFAPGWPAAQLTAERRLAALAAVLPGASVTTAEVSAETSSWEFEPVDETGSGYRIAARGGVIRATALATDQTSIRITRMASSRGPAPLARIRAHLAARDRLPLARRRWLGRPSSR